MTAHLTLSSVTGRALALALLTSVLGTPLWAQSLGQVAKEAEAQRKASKAPAKVYTNESLRAEPTPSAPATPAPEASPAETPKTDEKAKDEPAKDEAYWRDRIKNERDALDRSQAFSAALQSQINGLYAEFTACQAPPQCAEVSAKRQKAIADLDRVKKEVEMHTKAVADIQEEARRAGVPAGWVR